MRHSLIDLVKKTIILKFNLPYGTINRTSISSLDDFCYETKSNEELAELIYYSIVDYCLNNSEINLTDLNADQKFSIKNRLRYDENDDESTKLKYGFFGECLLNVILNVHFHTDKIIARGLLYSATNKRETTGYDCFHIIHSPNNSLIELWLGEVKMHLSFSSALETILTNLSNALSYKYLDSNFSVIFNREKDIDNQLTSLKFINLIKKWKNNQLNLKNEIINKLSKDSLSNVYFLWWFWRIWINNSK